MQTQIKFTALHCIPQHKESQGRRVPLSHTGKKYSQHQTSHLLSALSKPPAVSHPRIHSCCDLALQTQHSCCWGWAPLPSGSSRGQGLSPVWGSVPLEKCDPNKKPIYWKSSIQIGVLELLHLCEWSNESQTKLKIRFLPPEGVFLASLRTVQCDKR